MVRAARSTTGGTPRIPRQAASNTGKKAPSTITNTFEPSPRPNQTMASGIQASGGMGRSSSTIGRTRRAVRSDQPTSTPRVTAARLPITKPARMRPRLMAMSAPTSDGVR